VLLISNRRRPRGASGIVRPDVDRQSLRLTLGLVAGRSGTMVHTATRNLTPEI